MGKFIICEICEICGTNYYAIITGTVSQSGKVGKAWSAFEIFAKSYEAVIGIEQ